MRGSKPAGYTGVGDRVIRLLSAGRGAAEASRRLRCKMPSVSHLNTCNLPLISSPTYLLDSDFQNGAFAMSVVRLRRPLVWNVA